MADPHIIIVTETPLLNSAHNHNHNPHQQLQEQQQNLEVIEDADDLEQSLSRLEKYLSFLGFNQSTLLSFSLSWVAFIVIGVALPVVILELASCSTYQIKEFELQILASESCLAAVSLICLSHNLRKYGLRKFLFVDRYRGQMARFRDQYVHQISNSLRLLVWWLLPCFLLKIAREVVRILYVHDSWWLSVTGFAVLILSWTYVSVISLAVCALFHLLCNLQVIHFDDYAKLLERESEVLLLIEEHIRLRHQLSKISHRFRIFLLLDFSVVTISQIITLFQTTGYSGTITIINGGDFAVTLIVQVFGIILCLHAATKISHRAQNVASIAGRWHALVTCSSTDASQLRISPSSGSLEAASGSNSLNTDYSESDLESLDYVAMPTNTQLASYVSSYHKRQAFVMYLQTNPGGITIFGWTCDRGLINTIFFIQLTLITFVLGKTIISTSE
ncbi:DUF3537 domain-containing protein [Cephalotus follicularis]|uniref:DUF3537 domain-containing protein n=1 Tax=Cephalotus follicularis TaxID=3775 RepID=A0A1Q3DAV9_CEPFO|nr:DUF3537 domain-containing protein [Cephalotus follicularis]